MATVRLPLAAYEALQILRRALAGPQGFL